MTTHDRWPQKPSGYWPPQGCDIAGYPPPSYAPAGSARPNRGRWLPWTLLAALLALLLCATRVVLFVGVRHHYSASGQTAVSACAAESVPVGASPAAVAYVDAVNKTLPARTQLTGTIAAEGRIVHRLDLQSEARIDSGFLDDLGAIQFPPSAAPVAAALESDLRAYIRLLNVSFAHYGYFAAHIGVVASLDSERSSDSAQLREVLGLPPSHCAFLRP